MKRTLLLAALSLMAMCGCGPSQPAPPPKPEINIEKQMSPTSATLVVRYKNHTRTDSGTTAKFDNLESLREYKKQVEFLLLQIEEAEKRMVTNEQGQGQPQE